MNVSQPLCADIPSDNNCIESGNREDKSMIGAKRPTVVLFIPRFCEVLHCQSKADTKFIGEMKKPVRCYSFFESVQEILDKEVQKRPCVLNVYFKFVNKTMDLREGTMLAITGHMLGYIEDNYKDMASNLDSASKVKSFIKGNNGMNCTRK